VATKTQRKKKPAQRSGRSGARPTAAAQARPAGARAWIAGARLRTLPLSVAPVILGSAIARIEGPTGDHGLHVWHEYRIALCLILAVALQLGVNYANDYSDGIRGTDRYRVGPPRLVGSGAVAPRAVLVVALVFFAIGAAAGVTLIVLTQFWWLFAVGALALAAAWFYTGGRRPYGYAGLGEIGVFVFFGLVATAGSTYVQIEEFSLSAVIAGVGVGAIACAVLMVNNIRDRVQDAQAGKRTLAVRLGDMPSRIVFAVFVLVIPFAVVGVFVPLFPYAIYAFFVAIPAIVAAVITLTGKQPWEFILALQLTSLTALAYALALGAAVAF
jgi:1,4-dihydroxy-2-naphthoate octaprenyltransferase